MNDSIKLSVLFFTLCLFVNLAQVELTLAESPAKPELSRRIVFLGDSLTDGFGLSREQSYPALIQKRIEAEKLPYLVVNAGLSGETTAGGARRVRWLLRAPVDVLVIALGGNDGLRGLNPESTKENLFSIIEAVRKRQPNSRILLTGMLAPPNMGSDYESAFRRAFEEVAEQSKVEFLPFLLEGVAARPELNQADGIHPNAEGQVKIAAHVWKYLEPMLETEIVSGASAEESGSEPVNTSASGSVSTKGTMSLHEGGG